MLYRDASNLASMALNNHTPVAWITNRELSTDYFSNKETLRLNHTSRPMRGTNMPVVVTSLNEAGSSIPPEGTNYIPIQVFANAPGSMRNYSINYANVYNTDFNWYFNNGSTTPWTLKVGPEVLSFVASSGASYRWVKGEFDTRGIDIPTHLFNYIDVANGGYAAPPAPIDIIRTGDWRIVSNTMVFVLYACRNGNRTLLDRRSFSLGENCCFFASNTNNIVLPSTQITQTGNVVMPYGLLVGVLFVNIVDTESYCNFDLTGSGSNMYRGNVPISSFESSVSKIVQTV